MSEPRELVIAPKLKFRVPQRPAAESIVPATTCVPHKWFVATEWRQAECRLLQKWISPGES